MNLAIKDNHLPADIKDLTRFVLVGREKLTAVRAEIRAIDKLDLAKNVREQKRDEAQMLAGALLDAEVKMGDILKSNPSTTGRIGGGREKTLPEGITHKQSHFFQQLSNHPDIVKEVKAEAKENDDLPTRTEVLRKIKDNAFKKKRDEIKDKVIKPSGASVDIFNIKDKYKIIYADPPWKYFESGHKNQSNHYKTMELHDICDLPILNISQDNCILFLWTTYPMLEKSFKVISEWGFKYSTCGFNWVKRNKSGDGWFFGLGQWTRANSELCLIATKGKIERIDASISQIIDDPISEHSRKPESIRDKIISLVGDLPRIELFSRQDVNGWDVWGNEV